MSSQGSSPIRTWRIWSVALLTAAALLTAGSAMAQGGAACSQCGPGPHFIDQCGPFPPVGTDLIANNGAVVGIDLDFDCVRDVNLVLRPCPMPNHLLQVDKTLGPIDDSVNFPGTSPVDGHPTGPGLDVIDTEIVSMCLTNGAFTMAAGTGGPSSFPLQATLGTVAEDLATPDPTLASSSFDVFFEVSGVPGGPVYNQTPLQVGGTIDCLPPAANYYHPIGICVPLTTLGTCVGSATPCVGNFDCPGSVCGGTTVLANLVSANHSVNEPVCQESPFPECDGNCPAGEVCQGGANGCDCVPDVVPCDQSDPATCDGECPTAGDICTPGPVGAPCFCEPPPVACEQGPYPECGGECPAGTHCFGNAAGICECVPDVLPCSQTPFPQCGAGECPADQECFPDDTTGVCNCVPIGGPCTQCGPGPHFIDACGPFPPTGTDLVANNGAVVGIDLDFDCVRDINVVLKPCPSPNNLLQIDKTLGPIDDSGNFPGTSPVDGHPTGPGLDVIDTEIVAMCLTNGAITMTAGAAGPSALTLQPSLGTVAEDLTTPNPAFANSFFDVFFEVSGVPGGPVYNQSPLQVTSYIHCLPPAANYYHPTDICVPLTTAGSCGGGVNAGNACVVDADCPGSTCDGTAVLANLVSANHSVNQPVCQESPFPECGGNCPAGEACQESPDGCDCVPVPCEQTPFPECNGDCPAGETCIPDDLTGECICQPDLPCDLSPFPNCGGECPPDEICVPDSLTGECRCEPIPCEQDPFPACDGPCPANEICVVNDFTGSCRCEPIPCEQSPFPECGGDCPMGTHCEPGVDGTDTCVCVPDPVPCEASDPATCDGVCTNMSAVCTPDPTGGPCSCEVPPVPCAQSPFPECGGVCPPGTVCEEDPESGVCTCVPQGGPCTQCGPGPHFIDACGPFPPVGTDLVANNGALVGIDLDFDCVRDINLVLGPCPLPNHLLHIEKTLGPIDDSNNFPGTSPVDGHPTGPGLDVIDTEIVAMCLTNGAVTMSAGVGGPSALPLQPSLGTVAEDLSTPDPAWADSLFEVFFEVAGVPGGPLYNQSPLQVTSYIDCLPPAANYRHPTGICVPLTTPGICAGGVNGGTACVSDLDCPDATCIGTIVMANLVSANHSVNQKVCPLSPFPVCDGDCSGGETCLPGPDGCQCEPTPCEQGPFPECGGECPPGQICIPDDLTGGCTCGGGIPCQQSPFPECAGGCPQGLTCIPDPATGECRCDLPACQQSPFPECQGTCTPGSICTEAGTACDCLDQDTPAGGTPNGTSVPGLPLTLQKQSTFEGIGTTITLAWDASCSPTDNDFEIYEGSVGSYYSHESKFCSTGGGTTMTFTAGDGDTYYLVVPRNDTREGSYGTNSAGAERPQGANACLPQSLGGCP